MKPEKFFLPEPSQRDLSEYSSQPHSAISPSCTNEMKSRSQIGQQIDNSWIEGQLDKHFTIIHLWSTSSSFSLAEPSDSGPAWDFQFCYFQLQDLPHRCVGVGIKRNQKKKIIWHITSPSWCSINTSDIYWLTGSSIFFKISVPFQCMSLCFSIMPAARLTVRLLVSIITPSQCPSSSTPAPPSILSFAWPKLQALGSTNPHRHLEDSVRIWGRKPFHGAK